MILNKDHARNYAAVEVSDSTRCVDRRSRVAANPRNA